MVRYRLRGSRKRYQPTIGAYGRLTVAEARTQARIMLNSAQLGQDPQAEANARRSAEAARASRLTGAKLVDQYVTALHAGTATSKRLRGRQASIGYLDDTVLQLNRFAEAYGTQDASSISASMVSEFQRAFIRAIAEPIPSTHSESELYVKNGSPSK